MSKANIAAILREDAFTLTVCFIAANFDGSPEYAFKNPTFLGAEEEAPTAGFDSVRMSKKKYTYPSTLKGLLTPASAPARTVPGLHYEYFEGPWTELMVRSLTMPAARTGVLAKVRDVSPRRTGGAFGMRYAGYLDVPQDGVYTFYAPREFLFPDNDCGYDLRVFVDGREWYPAVRWHGHGTWSVALQKGKHPFQVVFVDLRLRPHKVELMWGFPHPDFTWRGVAPELLISGPGAPKQPVPAGWLCHSRPAGAGGH